MLKIYNKIDTLFEHQLFREYQQSYNNILQNNEALTLIEKYKDIHAQYADILLTKHESSVALEIKTQLQHAKIAIDDYDEIKQFYRISREIELFVDNLNYQINQTITQKNGTHCTCGTTK